MLIVSPMLDPATLVQLEAISDVDEAAGGGVVAVAEKQRVVRSATRETINLADTKSWPTTFRLLGEGSALMQL